MAGTVTIRRPRTQAQPEAVSERAPTWRVVLFNDDIHTFEQVVTALQKAAGLSLEVAEVVARKAHEDGSAVVRRGLGEDDARIICASLKRHSRIPGVTDGVTCQAELDHQELA